MVGHLKDLQSTIITHPSAQNASMKVLVGNFEGWEDHVMRVVEVDEDGYTPKHQHPWPHINYMIEGNGVLMIDGIDYPVEQGSYAFVPENTLHQFKNVGKTPFKFICIVPKVGHQ
ncbi:MAG: cupin domain-containing protein [Candidatus Izemoplasmataceae bacterium]